MDSHYRGRMEEKKQTQNECFTFVRSPSSKQSPPASWQKFEEKKVLFVCAFTVITLFRFEPRNCAYSGSNGYKLACPLYLILVCNNSTFLGPGHVTGLHSRVGVFMSPRICGVTLLLRLCTAHLMDVISYAASTYASSGHQFRADEYCIGCMRMCGVFLFICTTFHFF